VQHFGKKSRGRLTGTAVTMTDHWGYGVNVPAVSFQLPEWDIHALCFGTGDVRVARVRFPLARRLAGEARLERLGMLVSE
jgi:hypothetical protein